jgi:hypothetical protein
VSLMEARFACGLRHLRSPLRAPSVPTTKAPLSWTCDGSTYLGIPEELKATRKPMP